jgi:spore germination cell wall hydrolase CwlJ-like protein
MVGRIGPEIEIEGADALERDGGIVNPSVLSDRDVLALTLWAEARGEGLEGRVAVACVIRNRMRLRRQTASQVCLAPAQFSCWAPVDGAANYRALMAMADAVSRQQCRDEIVAECQWIADGVLGGAVRDLTRGADHYLTTRLLSSSHKPGWVSAMTWTATIGYHAFYRS